MSWATAESLSRNYSLFPAKAEKPNAVNEGRSQSLSTMGDTAWSRDAVRLVVGGEAAMSFQGGRMSCGPERMHQLQVLSWLLGSVCA
jgi:hypothetical protein